MGPQSLSDANAKLGMAMLAVGIRQGYPTADTLRSLSSGGLGLSIELWWPPRHTPLRQPPMPSIAFLDGPHPTPSE